MARYYLLALFLLTTRISFTQPVDDTLAQNIAGKVVAAMGGLNNFDSIHYIGWNFFGSRQIIWDKLHHRVRVDYLKKKVTIISDLDGENGKLFMNDAEIHDPDSLKKYLNKSKIIWMNDSYWLIMPFKLFDPGVNLKYTGIGKTSDNHDALVLELTFQNVGATPQNKYHIYIDPVTYFILQWDYYDKYTDAAPEITNIWGDYRKYGKIYLSGDRGTEGKITDIHIWDQLPENIFNDMKILQLDSY